MSSTPALSPDSLGYKRTRKRSFLALTFIVTFMTSSFFATSQTSVDPNRMKSQPSHG